MNFYKYFISNISINLKFIRKDNLIWHITLIFLIKVYVVKYSAICSAPYQASCTGW